MNHIRPELSAIEGLRWKAHKRIENGGGSFVIPFPRTRPATVVYHGPHKFEYGHYGIHLGQEDRLTFLGDEGQTIVAHFLDCRKNSKTVRRHFRTEFAPSSAWELRVPPGVAHAFENLQNVDTLNNYSLFLPDPEKWLAGEIDWDVTADVINIELLQNPQTVDVFEENRNEASDVFYGLVNEQQRGAIPNLSHSYPYTEKYQTDTGETVTLKIQEKIETTNSPDWEPIGDIAGLGWKKMAALQSGEHSGFVTLNDMRPYYVIDHGVQDYTHDAFGIHLGQIDHLMFLGPADKSVEVEFVDCRNGSKTLHHRTTHTFHPSALRRLVIPMGVAHRFSHIETVFTVNQGEIFLDVTGNYEPGNDVIDWPVHNKSFPELTVNARPADQAYYTKLKKAQENLLNSGNLEQSTPIVVMTKDDAGRDVRVAIRKSG